MPALLPNARNLIISNAKEILASDGYENFKMRKLATRCGMGLGTLYNYYVNKIALVYDLVNEDWVQCCKDMRSGVGQDGKSAVESLALLYPPLVEFVKKHRELWVSAILAGPMTLGDMGAGRYSPEKYYRDLYNILYPVLIARESDFLDMEFICRFLSVNLCRYAAEYGDNYAPIGQVFEKMFGGINTDE